MNKLLLFAAVIFCAATNTFAQKTFLLKDASKTFDVKIKIAKCDADICEGRASVYLSKKNQSKILQTIAMPNMYLELSAQKKPTANLIELYGENNSGVVFDDFNFDGAPDLALRNGNNGAYGGPSYDVLMFSKAVNKFIKSRELTKLGSENLGLFTLDKKQKTIETSNKSGCCYHETTRYKIINNRPQKVYVFIEDATGGNGEKVKLTTETLAGGKWKKTVKYAATKDYYKQQ